MADTSARRKDAAAGGAQVRAYLAALPPRTRRELRNVREAIRAAAPDAVEGFSYRLPRFSIGGRVLVWYGAFAHHIGIYPIGAHIRRACGADLKGYTGSTGTIRFPLDKPPSASLVKKLVKARAAEIRAKNRRART